MKKILIIGATGSIGNSVINLIKNNNDLYLSGFTYFKNEVKANFILKEFPGAHCLKLSNDNLDDLDNIDFDVVIHAIPGISGIKSLIKCIKLGKEILLANKESIVIFGNYIKKINEKFKTVILPIDSEHSSLFDLLNWDNNNKKNIKKIFITCSGGALRLFNDMEELNKKTFSECSKHPVWDMGEKITLDSATLFNKLFEVIEAKFYFDILYKNINILINHSSTVHSIIMFKDNSYKISFHYPSMVIPIGHAIYKNNSAHNNVPPIDHELINIKFEEFTPYQKRVFSLIDKFDDIDNIGLIINAINDSLSVLFKDNKIKFLSFINVLEKFVNNDIINVNKKLDSLEDYLNLYERVKLISIKLAYK